MGGCAASLLMGLECYRDIDGDSPPVPGVMHNVLGGYRISDIEVVAAFDVNADKIGKDISEAIFVPPNNAKKFSNVPEKGIRVHAGFLGDTFERRYNTKEEPGLFARRLKESGAQVVVNYCPVASEEATRFYAHGSLEAGAGFVNGIPALLNDSVWDTFGEQGLPLAGHDIMSQVGSTRSHRALLALIRSHGFNILRSMQYNYGGNDDFWHMEHLDDERLQRTKIASKTAGLISESDATDITVVPAKYDPALGDTKIGKVVIEAEQFGGFKSTFELTLKVEDSPNNAGVMIDVIRLMKMALDRGLSGYQDWSCYFFKHALRFVPLSNTRSVVESFIAATA
jgi:myo-inositol-1-phosphate synthase